MTRIVDCTLTLTLTFISVDAQISHLCKTHTSPVPREDYAIPEADDLTCANGKKIILRAIKLYDPDKIQVCMHGLKWKVLCQEASKYLNSAYEIFKGF
jgi:hypothetical protein